MPPTPSPKRHPYHQWAPDARALDLVGDKWTLLIVRDLSSGPRRFVGLQRVLPGPSTGQEVTHPLSIDAQSLPGYELRITDGGRVLTGTQVAKIQLGPIPALQLSPGQHQGVAVGGPQPAKGAGGSR